ncbi:hypothetical protein J26TS2_02510 [Shouchella clausii]|uniref:DUF6220 domain-containing protein n=1 Tax=Shouchella tritolerans TaxID=2979466 RepID=UPI0007882E6D|nr:DUF6220 domain-containing protein [Shouchella tritolerans]GIN10384.1 hypothetical protein J26TS2_02510 [Shouchella clausii]
MRIMKIIYASVAILFFISVLVQFFFAGMALFGQGSYWLTHTLFVRLFGLNLPIVLLLIAVLCKVKKTDYVFIASLFLLVFIMYATANIGRQAAFIGALHPVAGATLVILAAAFVPRAVGYALGHRKEGHQ